MTNLDDDDDTDVANAELFIDWIQKKEVLEYIFSGDVHIEIFKRVNVILKFLVKNKALKNNYLDMMWKASEGKHEEITRIVYDTFKDILHLLNFK